MKLPITCAGQKGTPAVIMAPIIAELVVPSNPPKNTTTTKMEANTPIKIISTPEIMNLLPSINMPFLAKRPVVIPKIALTIAYGRAVGAVKETTTLLRIPVIHPTIGPARIDTRKVPIESRYRQLLGTVKLLFAPYSLPS